MSWKALSIDKAASCFRDVLDGKLEVKALTNWEDVFAGNCVFDVGKFEVIIFNDCNEFDYVDSIRYGGSVAGYDQLYPRDDYRGGIMKPFTKEEWSRLESIFVNAKVLDTPKRGGGGG